MDNYENNNGLPEEEEELSEAPADGEDYSPEDTEEDDGILSDDADDGEEDDYSAVAEMITASRSRFAAADDGSDTTATYADVADGEENEYNGGRSIGWLFEGFDLKKTVVTVVVCLLTLAALLSSMAAAVAFADDKTKRPSDFDMLPDEEAETEAKTEAEKREPLTEKTEKEQFRVTLEFFDRDPIELCTSEITLGELIERAGIELYEGEVATVPSDTVISGDTTITFDKYTYTTDVQYEVIEYESEERQTDLIWRGSVNYIQYGKEGKAEITYTVKLKNGEEISREETSRETVEWPVNEIYEVGVGGTVTGADGKTYSYSMRKIVKATYYYIPNDPYTYLGNHPDHSTIAVDMNVIPLGTWLYVKNNRYDFGLRQAQDIGGAVKGDMIDIWLDGSEAGYSSFSQEGVVYDMEVYYID